MSVCLLSSASQVDDIRVFLPVSLADGKVRAHQNGINIIIETDFDLTLTYDTVSGVFLQIPSTYNSLPRGLCGNYNGKEPSADEKPEDIAAAWVVKQNNTTCETGCGSSSCPKPDGQKEDKAKKDCDIIKDQSGPFAGCHSTVNPTIDYKACVRQGNICTYLQYQRVIFAFLSISNNNTVCTKLHAKIKAIKSDRTKDMRQVTYTTA